MDVGGVLLFDDDEQPARPATPTPAPAIAMPFNNDRRLTESSAEYMVTVLPRRTGGAHDTSSPGV